MAKNLMILGTMSSAGKSYIVTGLCRYFTRMGYRVAPFKSQNMALNSFVTADGLEMGRAQVVQAYACNKEPDVAMNPVLLKPTTDVGSQVIVNGISIGNMKAREYFAYKTKLIPDIVASYNRLAAKNDIIIIEGAGSPAEINLRENDIVNMGLAELLDAPVILVGDIDPGGVFAQLYGTLELLSEQERERVKGLLINKFRGDVSLLMPGIKMLEEKCLKKVVGVVPMSDAKIEEEDSITSAFNRSNSSKTLFDIAVIRLPRISNFTDFDVFKTVEGVGVRYVTKPSEIGSPSLIILPGTKSTISDLKWLRETGLADCIRGYAKEIPLVGICGGYQMLGDSIIDPDEIEGGGSIEGLHILSMDTVLFKEKQLGQVTGVIKGATGFFEKLNGLSYTGYEIHNGQSIFSKEASSYANVFGTYVHGIFDEKAIAEAVTNQTIDTDYKQYRNKQFDIIADTLEANLDFDEIMRIMGL